MNGALGPAQTLTVNKNDKVMFFRTRIIKKIIQEHFPLKGPAPDLKKYKDLPKYKYQPLKSLC